MADDLLRIVTLQPTDIPLTERQTAILEKVARNGYVTIEALAVAFGVSAQTVRRDIIALSASGRLQRFHGGAGPAGDARSVAPKAEAARLDWGAKREIGRPEKAIVGRKAAAHVPDRAALYLDVGTTIEACARELARRPGFIVFTNSTRAAMAFDPSAHEVHVLGGRMAGRDGSLVGEDIIRRLEALRLDVAIIACSAIDRDGLVMDYDLSKIAVKRAAMAAAQTSLLVATSTKFDRKALGVIGTLDGFDAVVTDGPSP